MKFCILIKYLIKVKPSHQHLDTKGRRGTRANLKVIMDWRINDGDNCRKEAILPILLSNPNLCVPDDQAYKNWILTGIDLGVPLQQLRQIKKSAMAKGKGLLHGIVAELINEWLKELDRKRELRASLSDLVSALKINHLKAFGEAMESALLFPPSSVSSPPPSAEASSSGISRFEQDPNYFSNSSTNNVRHSLPLSAPATSTSSFPTVIVLPDEDEAKERKRDSSHDNDDKSSVAIRRRVREQSPASSCSSSFSYVSVNYDDDNDNHNESDGEVQIIPSSSRWSDDEDDSIPAYPQHQRSFKEEREMPDTSPRQHQSQSRMLLKQEMDKLQDALRKSEKIGHQSSSSSSLARSHRAKGDSYSRRERDKRKYDDDDRDSDEPSKWHRGGSSDGSHSRSRSSRFERAKVSNERRERKGSSRDEKDLGTMSKDSGSARAKRKAQVELSRKGLNKFHLAVQENRKSDVIKLIKEGADVNEPTSEARRRTPLHLAAGVIPDRDGAIAMIKLLLENGANPEATNSGGCLFMSGLLNKGQHDAITSNQFHDLAKFSISHGHSKFLIISTKRHLSVLQLAMKNKILGTETLKLLYEENVNLSRPSRAGYTLLYYAIWGGRSVAMMKQLIDCKVSWRSDVASKEGWNVLHVAAKYCHEDAFEFFLEMDGSLLDCKSREGETPVDLVRKYCGGSLRMKQILEKHGVIDN